MITAWNFYISWDAAFESKKWRVSFVRPWPCFIENYVIWTLDPRVRKAKSRKVPLVKKSSSTIYCHQQHNHQWKDTRIRTNDTREVLKSSNILFQCKQLLNIIAEWFAIRVVVCLVTYFNIAHQHLLASIWSREGESLIILWICFMYMARRALN